MPRDPDPAEGPTQEFDPLVTQASKQSGYVGTLIKDRYLVEKELGRGGFGVVYAAKDQQLHGKRVVVKVLTQDFTEDPWTLKKFKQEIEALARIDHPGVVGALDTGDTEDGKPFIVMQYIEGVTLRSEIGPTGMDLMRVADITRKIGQALSAAHDKGIWHRDLKPENIMLEKKGDDEEYVKLIDFGIAAIKDSQFNPTGANTTRVAGSFAYMSPEQFQGKVCAQSDVWSFGLIVWEMLTGGKPFPGETLWELMLQQQKGVTTDPREARPDLTPAAAEALLKALAVDVEERFARPKEFGDAFARGVSAAAFGTGAFAANGGTTAPVLADAGPLTGRPDKLRSGQDPDRNSGPNAAGPPDDRLDMAHVLFLDLVGYSALPMDQQRDQLSQLQKLVRETEAFREADRAGELLRLPTGDGMALTFFGDPIKPVECAVQLARVLRKHPRLRLRSGIHSGPVYRMADINANLNVSGGGINTAQRVMDCGDAGHILVSGTVAEVLKQFGTWKDKLRDLGEHPVKHGESIHLYNVTTADAGNPVVPTKLRGNQQSRLGFIAAAVVAVLAGGGAYYYFNRTPPPPPPPPKPVRTLAYYVTLKRMASKDEPVRYDKERVFGPEHGISLSFLTSEPGHLYLLNLGPKGDILVQHPNPMLNLNSSLPSGATFRVPIDPEWIRFDEEKGVEKLHVIWSAKAIPELEQAAAGAGGGAIERGHVFFKTPERVKELVALMQGYVKGTQFERDGVKKLTTLTSPNEVLGYVIELDHN